ncbi:hypothetical protein ADU37_CDS07720 [Thermococcus sp. 2319x1]|nr:hypothetical protein ADU37_CDS07720 [Thermococcus sp. 2319x1]
MEYKNFCVNMKIYFHRYTKGPIILSLPYMCDPLKRVKKTETPK